MFDVKLVRMNWNALLILSHFYLYMYSHPFEGVLCQRDVVAGEPDVSMKSVVREHFVAVSAKVSL
jgi:hypothetical protein